MLIIASTIGVHICKWKSKETPGSSPQKRNLSNEVIISQSKYSHLFKVKCLFAPKGKIILPCDLKKKKKEMWANMPADIYPFVLHLWWDELSETLKKVSENTRHNKVTGSLWRTPATFEGIEVPKCYSTHTHTHTHTRMSTPYTIYYSARCKLINGQKTFTRN